eukprot:3362207-Pyramimonas_sp.AAC.1
MGHTTTVRPHNGSHSNYSATPQWVTLLQCDPTTMGHTITARQVLTYQSNYLDPHYPILWRGGGRLPRPPRGHMCWWLGGWSAPHGVLGFYMTTLQH